MIKRFHSSRFSLFSFLVVSAALVVLALGSTAGTKRLAAQESLVIGTTYEESLGTGDTIRYTLEIQEDEFVLGEVDQIDVDIHIRVLDPEGEQRARFGALGRGIERFGGEPDGEGTYTFEFIGADEEEEGDFTISLLRHEALATEPAALVDQLMARYDGASPGAAVRVWRDGETIFSKSYGMANLAYQLPFREDTRTNIGSTSKQFTAFAIMLQAERGLLSLDDDIRSHIPELPDFAENIQVRHLITHTSGLREFLNLMRMTGRRLDHGDWIGRDEIIEMVKRQPALQNAPGAEWNYNNTAFSLAATIVERTSGMSFPEFMRTNVFEPIGMTRTMVRPTSRHIVPDASEGYTPGPDGYRQIGDLGGAVGAGAMYSTIGDLQRWVENYANPMVGTPETVEEMTTSFVLTNGEETGYGYGLSIDEQNGLKRVQHGGADVAHRSMLAWFPEINAGVTTQSNHASFDSGIAFRIAEAFFADEMEESEGESDDEEVEDSFEAADWDPENFDEIAGRYAMDAAPSFILTFTREDETLYVQATGQQRLEIAATSDSTFRILAVEAAITFHRGESGAVDRLTLHQGGDQPATRLDGGPWEPTAADLEDYTGTFFSEELETYYRFTVEDEELVLLHRRLDKTDLEAGEEDQFSGGGLTLEFERDRNDEVIGFYLSNVRTRDVRFARVP